MLQPFGRLASLAVPEPGARSPVLEMKVDEPKHQLTVKLGEAPAKAEIDRAHFFAAVRTELPKTKFEVLIATVPDPIESGQRYVFDTQVAALVLGMEASYADEDGQEPGALRDRDWLPWDDRQRDGKDKEVSEHCRREVPGVILFRNADRGAPKVTALLLVGESPILGVHPTAMVEALRVAEQLELRLDHDSNFINQWPGATTGVRERMEDHFALRIVGPSFSGSAATLRHAIDVWQREAKGRPVRIVSGSATGAHVHGTLRSDPPRRIYYHATTVPERALECSFLHYTRSTGALDAGSTRGVAVLDGVAMLRESGTEFGADSRDAARDSTSEGRCGLAAEMQLSFPYHVSTIRDAYESLDGSMFAQKDTLVSRHTTLDLSLRSASRLDMETQLSTLTRSAQDLALSNLLRTISNEGIRWVGIQATDIGDALFLARKIRDVAPDVRLAFFQADSLLLHPSLSADLTGSLVITPYPFFGTNAFRRHASAVSSYGAFENSAAEGVFNAVLALRDFPTPKFSGYRFTDRGERANLPIWTAALGSSELSPVQARPTLDCDEIVIGSDARPIDLCGDRQPEVLRARAWASFNELRILDLLVDPDVTPPRLWYFLFAILVIVAIVDAYFQQRIASQLPRVDLCWTDPQFARAGLPGEQPNDSPLDQGVIRTKWYLYATCSRLTLAFAFSYMSMVYLAAMLTYTGELDWLRLPFVTLSTVGMVGWQWTRVARFAWETGHETLAFRALLRDEGMSRFGAPTLRLLQVEERAHGQRRLRVVDWVQLYLGFHDGERPESLFYVSYAQLRMVAASAALVSVLFGWGMLDHFESGTDAMFADFRPVPALTLFVLRSLPLVNGVSPAFPLLVCLACVYVWAVGRMARLRLAYGISRAAPPDFQLDAVSTPIRAVLYPDHTGARSCDEGFTRCERRLSNAIVRPNGAFYFGCVVLLLSLPAVLFLLKLPTTLEGTWTTVLLFGSLSVCAVLISGTLVQLVQYYRALSVLLERVMAHPIAPMYQHVIPALQRSVDAQISGSKCELMRICATAAAFADTLEALGKVEKCRELRKARHAVLDKASETLAAGPHLADPLLRLMIVTAIELVRARAQPWPCGARADAAAAPPDPITRIVASVVALLVQRHVQQFRYFLYASTGSVLLLLLAISGYAFQPRRVLMSCIWSLTTGVVLVGLTVFVQLARAPLLNHLAGRPGGSGKLDWNRELVARIIVFVMVPLLSLLAAQYPDVAAQLGTIVEPFSRTLR